MNTYNLIKMNETFVVGSLFDCSNLQYSDMYSFNPLWKQTQFGCIILSVLRDMYHFNVTYVHQQETADIVCEIATYNNKSVDIFARPMSLRPDVLELTYPVHNLLDWNFGFTIYRTENLVNSHHFYRKPFSPTLWNSLYAMAFFCALLFYSLKRWEIFLLKEKQWAPSIVYEMLMIIGAYCQHIPPIDATLYSRRGAYFTFFLFAYLVYTYYTSNLLSHLVNDKDNDIDLTTLMDTDVECFVLEDLERIIKNIMLNQNGSNMTKLMQKVLNLKPISVLDGLRAIKTSRTALLSDYVSLEPFLSRVFKNNEICGLMKVDVMTDIKKYFFVSQDFPYKEEFKIALLRIEETGILGRFKNLYHKSDSECVPLPHEVDTQIRQVLYPLSMLAGSYLLSVVLLLGEIVHERYNRVFPYVE